MARIDLRWGGGTFNVITDLKKLELMLYSSIETAQAVHARFGGQNYYKSHTGLSGAGWVPEQFGLKVLSTYRVDSGLIEAPDLLEAPHSVADFQIIVPIGYSRDEVPADWPIFVVQGVRKYEEARKDYGSDYWGELPDEGKFTPKLPPWEKLYLVDQSGLWSILMGREDDFEDQVIPFSYYPFPCQEGEVEFKVRAQRRAHLHYRKALAGFFRKYLAFDLAGESPVEVERYEQTLEFWRRLGFRVFSGDLYKVTQGIAWKRYQREELSTVEALQKVAPANVHFLTPTLFLQETTSWRNGPKVFQAFGLFSVDGEEVTGVNYDIPLPVVLEAFRWNLFTKLLKELEEQTKRESKAE